MTRFWKTISSGLSTDLRADLYRQFADNTLVFSAWGEVFDSIDNDRREEIITALEQRGPTAWSSAVLPIAIRSSISPPGAAPSTRPSSPSHKRAPFGRGLS